LPELAPSFEQLGPADDRACELSEQRERACRLTRPISPLTFTSFTTTHKHHRAGCPISRVLCEKWGTLPAALQPLPVPTPTRMSATPARRMPAATGTRRTVRTTSVTRRTISARRPWLHHRLPHVQLRTRRSSSIRIRVATALRSPGISRGTAPIAAAPTAAAPPSFRRLAVRRRRERTEPAAITAFRRARAALCFPARARRT
jgi:hypothetical protein